MKIPNFPPIHHTKQNLHKPNHHNSLQIPKFQTKTKCQLITLSSYALQFLQTS